MRDHNVDPNRRLILAGAAGALGTGLALGPLVVPRARAESRQTGAGPVTVTAMVRGLDEPWAIAFLDNRRYLITERDGRLLYFDGSESSKRVDGVPNVYAEGQGGLLDVVVARDFASSGEIFLSYAERRGGAGATAVARARFDPTGPRLTGVTPIFRMSTASRGGRHFGSRIVEARDGTLLVTLGDRGAAERAQDPQVHNGKVVRITRRGGVPSDNPFVGGGALPEIYSLGHRNAQGAALDAQGRYWTVAHGAQGGDEINQPRPGRNYGWPRISYGRNYNGSKIGEGTSAPGLEQPAFYWDPSIAPSGLMIYSGRLWPAWRGQFFVGSLKFDMISRLAPSGSGFTEAERMFSGVYSRIRDVREAPDGSIWFLSVGDGATYRITPV
ncbi:PQQ-dependent sugar dehydrogenase [Oceanomicrobium pacificus]|uniref:PQQ-dependent sugar dehydrogenase n=1 Tax=Oceanomicrobium pacificus TaxID=2692916 RepID=A0A6B0U5E4_9RHOB|nr:PQQ-dependent sugar dehydrogenase [Oceanomicrobium pacificus]MXU66141.1 PQQ-dependent sugar dehydrogenase [Oceanomicrobium pacificus]